MDDWKFTVKVNFLILISIKNNKKKTMTLLKKSLKFLNHGRGNILNLGYSEHTWWGIVYAHDF
jgi:hypothetical protein